MLKIAIIVPKPHEKCNLEPLLEGARKQENRAPGARMPEITKIASKPKKQYNLVPKKSHIGRAPRPRAITLET